MLPLSCVSESVSGFDCVLDDSVPFLSEEEPNKKFFRRENKPTFLAAIENINVICDKLVIFVHYNKFTFFFGHPLFDKNSSHLERHWQKLQDLIEF